MATVGKRILATKEVTFTEEVLNRPISASIDSERNNGKSSFVIGDRILIDVITEASIISKFSNIGTLGRTSTDVKTITEYVAFINSQQANLSNIPSSNFSFRWVGSKIGGSTSINRNGSTLTMSAVGTGLIKATYKVNVIIYALSGGKGVTLCAFTNEDGNTASVQITLEEDCDTIAGPAVIIVVDYENGNPIIGATVKIDGINKGNTGTDGKLNVGSLSAGSHTLDIQKSGYTPSGSDCIDNESFDL